MLAALASFSVMVGGDDADRRGRRRARPPRARRLSHHRRARCRDVRARHRRRRPDRPDRPNAGARRRALAHGGLGGQPALDHERRPRRRFALFGARARLEPLLRRSDGRARRPKRARGAGQAARASTTSSRASPGRVSLFSVASRCPRSASPPSRSAERVLVTAPALWIVRDARRRARPCRRRPSEPGCC